MRLSQVLVLLALVMAVTVLAVEDDGNEVGSRPLHPTKEASLKRGKKGRKASKSGKRGKESHLEISGDSTEQLPPKLELWALYCSKMGDLPLVTTDLPSGFTCSDPDITTKQKADIQAVIDESIANEKSPEEAAEWHAMVEELEVRKEPLHSLVELREQIHRAGSSSPVLTKDLWPRRTIPYCWNMGWKVSTMSAAIHGMRTVVAHTIIRFERVECNHPGHKMKWQFVENKASSCVGLSWDAPNFRCDTFDHPPIIANTPAYLLPIPLPLPTSQALKYDVTRGNHFVAAHEILHNIGVSHTQSRLDRDEYVKVNANEKSSNCAKTRHSFADSGAGYSYDSLMHYKATGGCQLEALKAKSKEHGDPANMGQRKKWMDVDTKTVNLLYKGVPV